MAGTNLGYHQQVLKRKNRLYKTCIQKRTASSLEKYSIFTNKSNKLTAIIRSAERLYYNRCFDLIM